MRISAPLSECPFASATCPSMMLFSAACTPAKASDPTKRRISLFMRLEYQNRPVENKRSKTEVRAAAILVVVQRFHAGRLRSARHRRSATFVSKSHRPVGGCPGLCHRLRRSRFEILPQPFRFFALPQSMPLAHLFATPPARAQMTLAGTAAEFFALFRDSALTGPVKMGATAGEVKLAPLAAAEHPSEASLAVAALSPGLVRELPEIPARVPHRFSL